MWIYSIDKKQWRTMKHNVGPISRRAHAVTNLSGMVQIYLQVTGATGVPLEKPISLKI